jgi:branched-subunit amino acid ABC-type transport system permease component
MTPETAVVQALNGISFGALLFILAAGLSLIFGMMDVVNLAHGAFYMLGAYITLTVVQRTGQFWLALLLAPPLIGALGLVMEPLLLRRLRGRHLDQVLLTIGVSLVIADLVGPHVGTRDPLGAISSWSRSRDLDPRRRLSGLQAVRDRLRRRPRGHPCHRAPTYPRRGADSLPGCRTPQCSPPSASTSTGSSP